MMIEKYFYIVLFYLILTAVNLPIPAQSQMSCPTQARLLLGGNYPDPTILKHNNYYYLTHSAFKFRPGLLIWRSRNLKEWEPVTYALNDVEGDIWAPDLIEHDGKFYIYFPGVNEGQFGNWVVTADRIEGPWSKPVSVGVGHIDPGHVVGDDGKRYLHISGGYAVELSENGLQAVTSPRKVHDGWPIPEDWAIECYCPESPKFTKRNGWYYLTTAQGGTFGPSTSHMVTSFRSKSPLGPWENSPRNPVIHTYTRSEEWWSKGHGSLVEGPGGQWYCILHGIRNGYRTLGRSTLIEPIQWSEDDWYFVPESWPDGWEDPVYVDMPLSDEFERAKLGLQWQFYERMDEKRFLIVDGGLILQGVGDTPGQSQALTIIPRDLSYEIETEVRVYDEARAGLVLFVSPEEYIGLSIDANGQVRRDQSGYKQYNNTDEPDVETNHVWFRIVNNHQDVRFYMKIPGGEWDIMHPSMEISQNGIVRPALFAYGEGKARFEFFHYRILK